MEDLSRFVPGRFLGAWFPTISRIHPYDRRGVRQVALAADRARGTHEQGPYRLLDQEGVSYIELAPGWRAWLEEHRALVVGFTEQRLTQYLQARNPNVPGIVRKLELPTRRSLAQARAWSSQLIAGAEQGLTYDIFSLQPIGPAFELDHFLPWSFVAHDEFWNLCPVGRATNRGKGDHLPDLDLYLPRLGALHAAVLRRDGLPAALRGSYAELLGFEVCERTQIDADLVTTRYEAVIRPLAQIALNQGFPAGWRSKDQLDGNPIDADQAGAVSSASLGSAP